jgi:hypothetical protein
MVITGLLFMLNVSSAIAAEIYDGNLQLTSQAEVDSFNYIVITGSLKISGDDIQDLAPLSVLTSIGGYLYIGNNPALEVVDGFENLTELGGGLYVYDNPVLISFAGFNNLLATGDNIDFWYNDSLVSVSGFELLQTAGWSLEFGGNPVLTSIPNFESLQTISSSLFILDNVSLSSVTGFKALQYVDWSLDINGNTSLNNLCGFYDYFSANNPYSGGGSFNISQNHPDIPDPATIQDILDAGPCQMISPEQQIADLIVEIEVMGLSNRDTNNLVRSLTKAKKSLEQGRPERAVRQLEELINDIAYLAPLTANVDSNIDYYELTVAVQAIIDSINS